MSFETVVVTVVVTSHSGDHAFVVVIVVSFHYGDRALAGHVVCDCLLLSLCCDISFWRPCFSWSCCLRLSVVVILVVSSRSGDCALAGHVV